MKAEKAAGTIIFVDIIDFLKNIKEPGIEKIIEMLNDDYLHKDDEILSERLKILSMLLKELEY
jgi:hypothetical protein